MTKLRDVSRDYEGGFSNRGWIGGDVTLTIGPSKQTPFGVTKLFKSRTEKNSFSSIFVWKIWLHPRALATDPG